LKAIVNGKIITPCGIETGKALVFDEKIRDITAQVGSAEVIDAQGAYVSPGLVDMHIHGYMGEDASDGKMEGLIAMAEGIAKNGVTSWLPTTMTVSYDELRTSFALIRELVGNKKLNPKGAEVLGVNAEGPFINPKKKGAQAEGHIKPADAAFLKEYRDIIRVFTVAPEMPGNLDCIREIARDTDMLISMGHTDATYDQAIAGIAAGVRHTTHLFNAQTPLVHRDPGVVGAALGDDRVYTEIIADAFHIHPALFSIVYRLKGDKLVLITDCTRAGGLPDGEYTLGGQPFTLKGIQCRMADGTIAGSVLKLNNAVKNMITYTDIPLHEIVKMATLNPATAIKVNERKGSLEKGKDADILIASEAFDVCETILMGETIYKKEA
jgi:N-acetylglucosamine-6-phosphate deacetylase